MSAHHLYQENILDHSKRPRHFGHLAEPTLQGPAHNALCGDELTVELRIKEGKVADVSFTGSGCAISTASASMLLETLPGKSLKELEGVCSRDVLGLLGIDVGPTRIKCALLVLDALRNATKQSRYDPSA